MKRIVIAVLALMLVLPVAMIGWAQEPAAKAKESSEPASWKTDTKAEESATVTALDQSTRMVTLKAQGGKEFTFKAGKNVKHLDKISVGDVVTFSYYESLAVRVLKKDEAAPAVGQAGVVARGQAGAAGGSRRVGEDGPRHGRGHRQEGEDRDPEIRGREVRDGHAERPEKTRPGEGRRSPGDHAYRSDRGEGGEGEKVGNRYPAFRRGERT